MDLITIGSVVLPTPSTYNIALQDIVNAERNARAVLIAERIRANIRKIELGWQFISRADLAIVLSAISPLFFNVTYLDPVTNNLRTGTFYAGDRTVPMLDFFSGEPRYKDFTVNLIER
jgi:hypothetical protein